MVKASSLISTQQKGLSFSEGTGPVNKGLEKHLKGGNSEVGQVHGFQASGVYFTLSIDCGPPQFGGLYHFLHD